MNYFYCLYIDFLSIVHLIYLISFSYIKSGSISFTLQRAFKCKLSRVDFEEKFKEMCFQLSIF